MEQVERLMVADTSQDRHRIACGCGANSVSEEIIALTNMLRELAAIRSTAEDAAARILDSAEGLLALADKGEAAKAEAILSIMTACGFHDLVGQRVTRITETLDRVIATSLADEAPARTRRTAPAKSESGIVLEGPALPGSSNDQAGVDALFNDKR